MPSIISQPTIHRDLPASSGRIATQQPPAAGSIPGVGNIISAAHRGMLPGDRNAGARRLALSAAETAVAILIWRVANTIRDRKLVSDDNLDLISDATEALEAAGDSAAAAKNQVVAECWYELVRKLNRDGYQAPLMAQHDSRQAILSRRF